MSNTDTNSQGNSQPLWTSPTFWGLVVSLVGILLPAVGVGTTDVTQITTSLNNAIPPILQIVGVVTALIAHGTGTKPVSMKKSFKYIRGSK